MACMKLGSKPEAFHQDGHTWTCSSGLPSDIIVEVGEESFHLHKFPLLSRSGTLEELVGDSSDDEKKSDNEKRCILPLHDIPGGAKSFLLVAKFCYGVKFELTAENIVVLRCAADYLQMTEDYGEGNLITHTETFLNEVFGNWADTIKALETCEEVIDYAEVLHIVSSCINSLAMKACADPTLFSWPVSGKSTAKQSPASSALWNGICTTTKQPPESMGNDWWYEDVSNLKLPIYRRIILSVYSRSMSPDRIAGSLMFYAKKYLPLMGRQSNSQNGKFSSPSDADQKTLLEEIVNLLPDEKGVIPTNLLLKLLRTSMILHSSPSCRETLEKRVGAQLDQAVIEDILIPNMGYSMDTLYDIDCVERILDYFMLGDRDLSGNSSDEGELIGNSHSLTPMTMVANLMDSFLAEVAPDVNLKLAKFQSLASAVPDYSRPVDDGIYRAIDVYLKAHPWLTDSEREQLCRLMNCQKLSLEASTHAAQNERLPLRVIVQVLFFEQLRLRTSVAGWLFVSDQLENSQNLSGNLGPARNDHAIQAGPGKHENPIIAVDDMKERVSELEKECLTMKKEIDKLVKTKGMSWNNLCRIFGLKPKSKSSSEGKKQSKMSSNGKVSPTLKKALLNGNENHENGEFVS